MPRWLRALLLLVPCLALAGSAAAAPPTVTITDPNADGLAQPLAKLITGTFTGRDDPNSTTEDFTILVNSLEAQLLAGNTYQAIVELPLGSSVVTVTATDNEGTATATRTVVGNPRPVITITQPVDGFTTGDLTVEVSGSVTDDNLDPNNPNTLIIGSTRIPLVDPNAPSDPDLLTFSGKVAVGIGEQNLSFRVQDKVNNVVTEVVEITRTTVCQDPNEPPAPRLYRVTRFDDLPMPASFTNDPNAICDVRPALRPEDPDDPNDPNDPVVPPPFNPPSNIIGGCTLRAAVQAANAHPGIDVIQLPSGTVRLTRTRSTSGEDLAERGDLDVTEGLIVKGFGRDISFVDARKLHDRVFDVREGVELTLRAATVRGGSTPKAKKTESESGGCLRVEGSLRANNLALLDCKSGADGGAIALQDANAALTCTIVARSSAKADGGGIALENGSLTLRNSTIAFSSSGASGGALANRGGTLVMTNATLSTNKAKTSGGGLALAGGAEATLNNVTFAKNKAKNGLSLSTRDEVGGTNDLEVSNSILGDKPKKTCDILATSPVVSLGGNLEPGVTCDLTDKSDLDGADPRLNKLATNVGVPTHGLASNSPAIDHGIFATCEPLDQRNADRVDGPPDDAPSPDDDVCDSGAFEFASEALPEPEPEPKK